MNSTASRRKITLSADGRGLVSHDGGLLLLQTLRITGLDKAQSQRLERRRPSRAIHDPAKTPVVGQSGVRIVGRWPVGVQTQMLTAASRQASARVTLPLWWIETIRQTSTARIGTPAGPGRGPSSSSINGMMPESSNSRA